MSVLDGINPCEVRNRPSDPLKLRGAKLRYVRRVLFVGIDGVLHSPDCVSGARPPTTTLEIRHKHVFAFEHERHLAELLKGHNDVAVVVISAWRMSMTEEQLADIFWDSRKWYCGSVGHPYRDRAFAIRAWLQANPKVQQFAVLDDERAYFPGHWPSLILCDPATGLSARSVREQVANWLESSKD